MILTNNVLCLFQNTPAKLQKYLIFKDIFRKNIGTEGKNVVSLQKFQVKTHKKKYSQ